MARFHLDLGLASSGTSPVFDDDEDEEEEEEEEEEEDTEVETEEEEDEKDEEAEEEEEEEEEEFQEVMEEERPVSSSPALESGQRSWGAGGGGHNQNQRREQQYSVMASMVAALRKSLVMCSSVEAAEDGGATCRCPTSPPPPPTSSSGMEIGWPTDVRHVAHVTFDRFDGFLGLPVELQHDVPRGAPSASASVFGVSPESMQSSYDSRGNSVPTILLAMQQHLYLQGGLLVEGIFRINAENGQEMLVRDQLNRGIVPNEIELHCLAGLIKAWFRELPKGILDSLTPDQVMHCNTEEECSELVRKLPPTETALLDWAINLMADVVEHEGHNKMNARNIAMVFAPNMTQMADPLTALIHAVQVMNFLRTLIIKTIREREAANDTVRKCSSCSESPSDKGDSKSRKPTENHEMCTNEKTPNFYALDKFAMGKFLFESTFGSDAGESFCSFEKKPDINEGHEPISSSVNCGINHGDDGSKSGPLHGNTGLWKGVRKLCRHPVFQLSRSTKKFPDLSFIDSRSEGREACA